MSGNQLIRSVLGSVLAAFVIPFLLQSVAGVEIGYTLPVLVVVAVVVLLVALASSWQPGAGAASAQSDSGSGAEVQDEGDVNDSREIGDVKWFDSSKGYGFITRENGDDVFVHYRNIRGRGHRSLNEGQTVRFSVRKSEKGLQAEDVTVVRS